MRRLIFTTILCLSPFILAGCSTPRVELVVASQPNVNPDHSGRPSPVIMKMYELSSDLAFKQGEFNLLFENPVQALGNDLIAADELVFVPGEARTVEYKPDSRTKYVGILLGFRQMERARWRAVQNVDPEKTNRVCIELTDTTVILIEEPRADGWDPVEAVRTFQKRIAQPLETDQPGSPPTTPGQGYVLPSAKRM